ncbi:glycosyltransferase [Nodularia spumigena CS-591/12]|uniref:glycosyltransferase family 4 protein n=1 Tax=Nodularia spumigena TaxID=70799 RepID=UPI00232AFDC6|nr:glycosyltransferase [Nodularia spumigena]MDB9303322.1 glycosyltransferase [Nodularia spumigena CS-591/12]MDB9347607.1 glycosyltransferase [Nodularia spumigena CS-588/01]MDB9353813.1 glycosyltransferase [Nodularia spumigena CS-588/05]
MDSKILWLRERFGWMGKYSGYDQVCETIDKLQPYIHRSIFRHPDKTYLKILGRLLGFLKKSKIINPGYNLTSTIAELNAIWTSCIYSPSVLHITYVENHLEILPQFRRYLPHCLVGTCHQPASWWRLQHSHPEIVSTLDALIVVAKTQLTYFNEFLPNRVYFIPHGVDIEFFKPDTQSDKLNTGYPRCVFSGTWLRDLETLSNVIDKVISINPGIKFDIIIPRSKRKNEILYRIARHEQVSWHAGMSDEQLLRVYQQATLLLLPLLDCTANNALLESMACGLPIVSNNVGGLIDYTQSQFAELLPVGDVDGLAHAVLDLVDRPMELRVRGEAARSFTELNFSWEKVALQTLSLYQQVSN